MTKKELLFPSPYGVSFILTELLTLLGRVMENKFPSPYGVLFILIGMTTIFT